jgi:hypothetical protein
MKLLWEDHLGKNPVLYARKVLKECGFKYPPVCERTIADYLGLEIKEHSLDGLPHDEDLHKALKTACAWLKREPGHKPCIGVYRDSPTERKRLGIVHECSHNIVPWHEKLNYFCSENDLGPTTHKRIEREAFKCGAEVLMPREIFVEDLMSLRTGILAIEQLHTRYVASIEATAIQYAYRHPGLCGVVMVEKMENQKSEAIPEDDTSRGRLILPFEPPPERIHLEEDRKYPIRVKYFVQSHRFPKFIPPGTGIEQDNLVFEAWDSWKPKQGEIPASAFGSSKKLVYNAECLPLGNTGKLLVLLWLPDRYLKFNFKNGVIL